MSRSNKVIIHGNIVQPPLHAMLLGAKQLQRAKHLIYKRNVGHYLFEPCQSKVDSIFTTVLPRLSSPCLTANSVIRSSSTLVRLRELAAEKRDLPARNLKLIRFQHMYCCLLVLLVQSKF